MEKVYCLHKLRSIFFILISFGAYCSCIFECRWLNTWNDLTIWELTPISFWEFFNWYPKTLCFLTSICFGSNFRNKCVLHFCFKSVNLLIQNDKKHLPSYFLNDILTNMTRYNLQGCSVGKRISKKGAYAFVNTFLYDWYEDNKTSK